MLNFLKRLFAGLTNSSNVRRAVRGFLITFAALFVPGLLGWLHLITEWANSNGGTAFPDGRGLAYLAVSATVAGVVGLLNLVVNALETASGKGVLRTVPSTQEQDQILGLVSGPITEPGDPPGHP